MRTREPRLWLSLQQALASMAQPCFADILCAAGVSASSPTHTLSGAQNSHRAEQMSKALFGRTGAALCAQGPVPQLLTCVFSLARELAERER